ncbi:2-hydroxyacid dehydrogenase [Nitrincola sp.]|uniref:2-hydroxyacid dehydrogenase n=1 Tax=Nitrincola sp. TaxID=1926584 RepID=UPI003A931402
MNKIDVLVVWPNRPEQMKQLDETYHLHRLDQAADPDALLDAVGSRIRAVVTSHGGGFSADLLARLPNLEIVASSGVGIDSLCVEACRQRGIPVTHTPDVLNADVADMGMLLLLATLRRLLPGERWIREGHWRNQGMMPLNTSVQGKRLGIVGFGRIGKAVAVRAEAFGMQICYYGRHAQPQVAYPWYADLIQLAQDCDVLLLTVPANSETHRLINAEVLTALGPQGYLINIARGAVVDESALIEALQQGRIAGAGLDVFVEEPNVPDALLALDNVVLQPHCASGTVETRGAMAQLVVDNLAAHFSGRALLTPVKKLD